MLIQDSVVVRAKQIITMRGEKPARGRDMFQPIAIIDNGMLLIRDGSIIDIDVWNPSRIPYGFKIIDLGDICLIPQCVNAHTHLDLSWLKGKLNAHQNFTLWIKSLVDELLPVRKANSEIWKKPLNEIFEQFKEFGIGIIGDINGGFSGSLNYINAIAKDIGITIINFCELFGFNSIEKDNIWPRHCIDAFRQNPEIAEICVPSPHTLYTTSAEKFTMARDWCCKNGKILCFHLAESPEETELVEKGAGSLYDFYHGIVIPKDWQPYALRPEKVAEKFNLLQKNTLAVHGVQLNDSEIASFAASGASLCLCPRSNNLINVGHAPIMRLLNVGIQLCIGTDGLSSNKDLDPRNDAIYLRENTDIPGWCLLRMLTINGAAALGVSPEMTTLKPGNRAFFSTLPLSLFQN